MPNEYDDEILPVTPIDAGTPFILQPGARTSSVFPNPFYPHQGDGFQGGMAGELRGLYGSLASLAWRPDWSDYRGQRPTTLHRGVDIYGPVGQAVVAAVDGELDFQQEPGGLGLYAVLAFRVNGETYRFHYGHLNAPAGGPRSVSKGEVIGYIGCSGNADNLGICSVAPGGHGLASSHLHFALRPPAPTPVVKRANPLTVLDWRLHTPSKPGWV